MMNRKHTHTERERERERLRETERGGELVKEKKSEVG